MGLTLLTVGVPTLFLTMWARPEPPDPQLLTRLWRFVVPAVVVTAAGGVALYAYHYTFLSAGIADAPEFVLESFERYTGVSSDDVGFPEAAATIGAQTALSTFVSYAAFLLILFLRPPNRFFASWARPDGDRRPALNAITRLRTSQAGRLSPSGRVQEAKNRDGGLRNRMSRKAA